MRSASVCFHYWVTVHKSCTASNNRLTGTDRCVSEASTAGLWRLESRLRGDATQRNKRKTLFVRVTIATKCVVDFPTAEDTWHLSRYPSQAPLHLSLDLLISDLQLFATMNHVNAYLHFKSTNVIFAALNQLISYRWFFLIIICTAFKVLKRTIVNSLFI
jgi:hypothetical protein